MCGVDMDSLAVPQPKSIHHAIRHDCGRAENGSHAKCPRALVYVNEDGSVRELTEAEKKYVDAEFSPLDGARPYVKSRYTDRTAWGLRVHSSGPVTKRAASTDCGSDHRVASGTGPSARSKLRV